MPLASAGLSKATLALATGPVPAATVRLGVVGSILWVEQLETRFISDYPLRIVAGWKASTNEMARFVGNSGFSANLRLNTRRHAPQHQGHCPVLYVLWGPPPRTPSLRSTRALGYSPRAVRAAAAAASHSRARLPMHPQSSSPTCWLGTWTLLAGAARSYMHDVSLARITAVVDGRLFTAAGGGSVTTPCDTMAKGPAALADAEQ